MNGTDERPQPPAREPAPRYCGGCGEIFAEPLTVCPNCEERWPFSTHLHVQPLATILTEFGGLHDARAISGECYATLRRVYERRLIAIRPPRRPVAPMPAPAPVPAPVTPAPAPAMAAAAPAVQRAAPVGWTPPQPPPKQQTPPRPPRKPAGVVLAEWTAARQADILLYLGAFFLVISALIFTQFQGAALSGLGRFALLVAYTGGFLAMGLLLPRWERVREAGSIFLGLGAVLVPVCFIALRTQVLDGDVRVSIIWLIGSVASASLYYSLAVRGYGRLYAVPGALASMLAWGSLGVVIYLPAEWFGAWFAGGAAALHLVSLWRTLPAQRWVDVGAVVAGAFALLYAHLFALDSATVAAQLPLTYALVTAAAVAELVLRGTLRAKGAVPALAALTGLTATWATVDLGIEWYGSFAVAAAIGYLLIAHWDAPERAFRWGTAAGTIAGAALVVTHAAMGEPDASRWALVLTYALSLVAMAGAVARWRWRVATGSLPVLAAGLGASFTWAAVGLPAEWLAVFVVAAGLGYLLVAHFDPGLARPWALGAAAGVGFGLMLAHVIMLAENANNAALPVSYALALLGAGAATVRWRWREAMAALPPLVVGLAASATWAVAGLPLEWFAVFVAAGGLGYLLIGHVDDELARRWAVPAAIAGALALLLAHVAVPAEGADHAALPLAYALALLGAAAAVARWRWREAMALLSPLAAGLGASGMWAIFGLPAEWLPAFIAGAGLGYLVTGHFDDARSRAWAAAAALTGALAIALAHLAVQDVGADRAVLPSVYAIALVGAAGAYARWRAWEALAAIPALAAAFGAATFWAVAEPAPAWLGCWIIGAGLGYLAIAELDGSRRREWRLAAGVVGLAGLLWAHVAALNPAINHWQLPLAHGLVLAGLLWDGARRRDEGLLALPASGALFGASVLWAAGVSEVWWAYPGLAACAVILLSEPWWRSRPVLGETGWPYLLIAAVVIPLLLLGEYRDAPAHGMAAFAIAAALVLASALRVRGALVRLAGMEPDAGALLVERQMLARLSGAYLFAAASYFNGWAGLEDANRAWVFAGIGTAAWLGPAAAGARVRGLAGVLAPVGAVALVLAAWVAREEPSVLTIALALGAAGPALAFASVRWLPLWGLAAANGLLAVATGWEWSGLDRALLPLAYVGIGTAMWAGLLPLRRYGRDARSLWIAGLSWASWVVALGTGYAFLMDRESSLTAAETLVRTGEWAVLAIVVAALSALVVAEGVRLSKRWLWTAGTAGLMGALLIGIAITEPGNVQAYTLPLGLYLVALGLGYRRSPEFFGAHMAVHEAVIVAGLLALAVPPALQSFEPGGERYGLELIGAGFVFLAIGFVLGSRWLAAGGVLTLTGVALRWLFLFSTEAPYWLTLGLAGMALLAIGLLLLLERDQWDRARARIARWWIEGAPEPSGPAASGPV